MNEFMFSQLPYDVNMIIFEYEGSIKNRNGIFMNQISKNDYRYNILLDIPTKKIVRTTYGWDIRYNIHIVFKNKPYYSFIRSVTTENIVDSFYIGCIFDNSNILHKHIY